MQKHIFFLLLLAGCSKVSSPVQNVAANVLPEAAVGEMAVSVVQSLEPIKELNPAKENSHARIAGEFESEGQNTVSRILLRKEAILNRDFLYGAALQSASVFEEGEKEPTDLTALAIGLVPAQFKVMGQKLRLITDSRVDFESDVNTPSRLIFEFPIIEETSSTILIQADQPSPLLDTLLNGKTNKILKRAQWIRSLEYAKADDLFLIQSSIELVDGTLAEFMETLTPREKIVPKDVSPIFNDEDLNPDAARYGFLDAGDAYINVPEKGRVKTKAAVRYNFKNEPIRWYVTPNVPDKYLADVKNGVLAWNRYAKGMGMNQLVSFEGKVPEGVKIGDPRYNIIVWNNVADADAAYESQAADPFTGIQSYSLIYIPLAWINIGKKYWENATATEQANSARTEKLQRLLKNRKFAGRSLPVNCLSDAQLQITPDSAENPEELARGLLKAVVFHEVGHALGLDHNFKGSLSFDPDHGKDIFSYSIMDYNQYNEEHAAFSSLESADGPLLEYDRQIISVLYNNGKDVKETDPEIATCGDEVADSSEDGVDPLCLRYDIGTDPTARALRSIELLSKKESRSGKMLSLPTAMENLGGRLPDPLSVKKVEDAKKEMDGLAEKILGTASLYVSSSANSLSYIGSQSLKSLRIFQPDVLPKEYEEAALRANAIQLLEAVQSWSEVPAATQTSLAQVRNLAAAWLAQVPEIAKMADGARKDQIGALLKPLDQLVEKLNVSQLSKVRTKWAASFKRDTSAPLAIIQRDGKSVDVESLVISYLENLVSPKVGSMDRPMAERLAGATNLASYAKIPQAKEAAARLREEVSVEIRSSTDARKREPLRKLLEALSW